FVRTGDSVVAGMRDPARSGAIDGAECVTLDVCDDASVTGALAGSGAFDVVVNNAGISLSGPVETIDTEAARLVFETNYWGALRVVRATLPAMRARRSGLIINVSTVGGRTPTRGYHAFYQGSKHALRSLSEALVWELEPFGVRVALLEPGFVATNIFDRGGYEEDPPPSPYADDEAWVRRFFLEGRASHAIAASTVADEIVAIADQPRPDLHHPVGPDAVAGVAAAQAMSFEDWYDGAVTRVASMAGPRPGVEEPEGESYSPRS
ncbi:MAG: SDR family NAD(P)-dependent oxidoreductase, partial [Actinomycetota bacterium]|nr:SDR family NAD(P)-dependent oxidoreductase [Actinomycetota bacterium]